MTRQQDEETDQGAGLIHQAIPDVEGTEPRLNEEEHAFYEESGRSFHAHFCHDCSRHFGEGRPARPGWSGCGDHKCARPEISACEFHATNRIAERRISSNQVGRALGDAMTPHKKSIEEATSSVREAFGERYGFRPCALFDEKLDCIRVIARDCSVTEIRIDEALTVLESNVNGKYVGFTIKGAKHFCKRHNLPLVGPVKLADLWTVSANSAATRPMSPAQENSPSKSSPAIEQAKKELLDTISALLKHAMRNGPTAVVVIPDDYEEEIDTLIQVVASQSSAQSEKKEVMRATPSLSPAVEPLPHATASMPSSSKAHYFRCEDCGALFDRRPRNDGAWGHPCAHSPTDDRLTRCESFLKAEAK